MSSMQSNRKIALAWWTMMDLFHPFPQTSSHSASTSIFHHRQSRPHPNPLGHTRARRPFEASSHFVTSSGCPHVSTNYVPGLQWAMKARVFRLVRTCGNISASEHIQYRGKEWQKAVNPFAAKLDHHETEPARLVLFCLRRIASVHVLLSSLLPCKTI